MDYVEMTWEQICENIHLMERITGRMLHHGETHYDVEPFYTALAKDSSLVAQVLTIYGVETTGNADEDLEQAEVLTEEAFFVVTE